MPIVFEEVTGEIAPERGAAPARAGDQPERAPDALAAALRAELQLLSERQRRLSAD